MRRCKREKKITKEKNDFIHTNPLLEYQYSLIKIQRDEISRILKEKFQAEPEMLQIINQIEQNESNKEYGPKSLCSRKRQL